MSELDRQEKALYERFSNYGTVVSGYEKDATTGESLTCLCAQPEAQALAELACGVVAGKDVLIGISTASDRALVEELTTKTVERYRTLAGTPPADLACRDDLITRLKTHSAEYLIVEDLIDRAQCGDTSSDYSMFEKTPESTAAMDRIRVRGDTVRCLGRDDVLRLMQYANIIFYKAIYRLAISPTTPPQERK